MRLWPFGYVLSCFIVVPVLSVLTTDVTRSHVIHQNPLAALLLIQLDAAGSVAAVPEAVVTLTSVRILVLDEKHILLKAVDVVLNGCREGLLVHMPDNFVLCFFVVEVGAAVGPQLNS